MNFQRGLAPTEAMGVGQIAIAPEMKTLYQLDPTRMEILKNGKAFPHRMVILDVIPTMNKVRDGEINPRFIAFTTGDEIDEFGDYVIHRLSEYKGLFVKLGDQTYKIPK
jgi:hypothetical protein